jgi:hypothetical protein
MTTSFNPIENAKETLLGMTLSLEQRFGCTPRNDISTTLNSKFNVFPTRLPANPKIVKYFCMGTGGRLADSTSLVSAQYPMGTDMALYDMRPFRAVPLAQDLSATERAKYAMRQQKVINGVTYCLYYLKLIDFTTSQIQYTRTDPTSGTSATYTLDAANLSPTPPVANSNGVITDVADQISVILPGTMTITGQEVYESVAVTAGGDARYASVSEVGFVSASTELMQAVDASGAQFTYNEAIMAQLVNHYTWTGQTFLSTADTFSRTINMSIKNLLTTN